VPPGKPRAVRGSGAMWPTWCIIFTLVFVTDYLEVSTTAISRGDAGRLATAAVTAKLAVSARVVGPAGNPDDGDHWRVYFKTPADRYPDLQLLVLTEHPHNTPDLVAIPLLHDTEHHHFRVDPNP
jgi:periplasmic divalent cation tolerance protein